MSDIIQLLPDSVANQIAAGEVIQRPASVVKELMENSIDAGAHNIQVILKDAGRTSIQIIDNGKGMSPTDARMAFERHATSKIKQAADLFALKTMGFRGEALASIAAIAQIEMKTRVESEEIGTLVRISGSQVEQQEPVSSPVGTNMQVKNIFFNVPARRKFLKSNQTELSNIITEFERVALVNPDVSFSLVHNDNEIINIPATNLRQRIINLFGKSLNQQLLSVEVDTALISVNGYIGRPEAARKKNALQYFFVNGRYMRHPYFHKAVMQSFETLIPAGEQPNYFLYFNVDPANIDVNIHPTKTEIKFENEPFLWQIISAAIKEALGKFSAVPSIDFDMEDAPDIPIHTTENIQQPKPKFNTSYNPFNKASNKVEPNWQELYKGFENDKSNIDQNDNNEFFNESFSSGLNTEKEFDGDPDYFHTDSAFVDANMDLENADSLETVSSSVNIPQTSVESKVFSSADTNSGSAHYQFKGRYIVTSVKSGMMMIDQHRAHIRVLFDSYIDLISLRKGVTQGVLFPEIINFAPSDVPILEEINEDLKFLGFDLNNMGGCSYSINGIPSGIEGLDIKELIHSMVDTAKEKARDVKTDLHEVIALSLAQAAAIPYGEFLNNEEMEKLIDDLFASSSPNYTPDGNLILSVLTNEEIEKRFKI
ncbi:MAG: DNA mismatch repair endonuclease MutL [Bacteroidales bacterium]|nr:DNA mismatch repair endonuclease MutL [Bacteroidales bacterium]